MLKIMSNFIETPGLHIFYLNGAFQTFEMRIVFSLSAGLIKINCGEQFPFLVGNHASQLYNTTQRREK